MGLLVVFRVPIGATQISAVWVAVVVVFQVTAGVAAGGYHNGKLFVCYLFQDKVCKHIC